MRLDGLCELGWMHLMRRNIPGLVCWIWIYLAFCYAGGDGIGGYSDLEELTAKRLVWLQTW
jgi:hypothetical protein